MHEGSRARASTNGRVVGALLAFVAVTFAWTWGLWALLALTDLGASGWASALFVASTFGPGVAAMVTVLLFEGPGGLGRWARRCVRWRVGWRLYAVALLAAPLLLLAALALHVVSGGTIPASTVQGHALVVVAQFATVVVLGGPLGEEFGWRGYALPLLTQLLGWRGAALVLGVVWAVWHLPLFWMPGTAQAELPVGLFLLSTVALSVVFARLACAAAFSVVPALLLHGSINWSALVLPVMPRDGNARIYAIAVGLLVAVALVQLVRRDSPRDRV